MILCVTSRRRSRREWSGRLAEGLTYLAEGGVVLSPAAFRRQVGAEIDRQRAAGVVSPLVIGAVHGYNTSHAEALEWFAQVAGIVAHLPGPPIVIGFSWPSNGQLAGYVDDRTDAERSALLFVELLRTAVASTRLQCVARLALVAWSMGNHLLAHAARHAWEGLGRPAEQGVFAEVALCAADLDDNALEPGALAAPIGVFARRVTVYHHAEDGALAASSAKRLGATGPRLGRRGPADLDALAGNTVVVDLSACPADDSYTVHALPFHHHAARADLAAVLAGVDRSAIGGRVLVREGARRAGWFRVKGQ